MATILFPTYDSDSDDSSYAPSSEDEQDDDVLKWDTKSDLIDVEQDLIRELLEQGVTEEQLPEVLEIEKAGLRAEFGMFQKNGDDDDDDDDDESTHSEDSSVTLGEASFQSCPSVSEEDLKVHAVHLKPLIALTQNDLYGEAIKMINDSPHLAELYFQFPFLRYDTCKGPKRAYGLSGTLLHYFCSRFQLIPVELFRAVLIANPQAALMRGRFLHQPSRPFYIGEFSPLHMLCRNIRLDLLEEMEHRQLVFIKEITRVCPYAAKVYDSVFNWLPLHELCSFLFSRPRNLEIKVEVLREILGASGLDALKLSVGVKPVSEGVVDIDSMLSVPLSNEQQLLMPLYAPNHNRYAIELLLGLCDPLYSGKFELDTSAEPFFAQCVSMMVECDIEPNPVSAAQCNALYYAITNFQGSIDLSAFIFKALFSHDLYPSLKRLYEGGSESLLSTLLNRYKLSISPCILKTFLTACPFQLLIPGQDKKETPFTIFKDMYECAIVDDSGEDVVARMNENLKVITFGAIRAFCPIEFHKWTLSHFPNEPFDDNHDSPLVNSIKANRTHLKEHFWQRMPQSDPSEQVEFLLSKYPLSARTKDGNGKLPLTIAIEHFETNGLSWEIGVKTIANCAPDAIRTRDVVTHLYPFMSASLAGDTYLTFELLRRSPDVVKIGLL